MRAGQGLSEGRLRAVCDQAGGVTFGDLQTVVEDSRIFRTLKRIGLSVMGSRE
jgi:hypothetical protein